MTLYTRRLDEVGSRDRGLVGGKCASLGEMISAGLPVPEGFAVTVDAFEAFRATDDLRTRLTAEVRSADVSDAAALQRAHDRTVAMVLAAEMPRAVEADVRAAYDELDRRVGRLRGLGEDQHVAVAVRSSSVDEDGEDASFAGQQETYLWVTGADEVVQKVRECWASLYTPQAIAYRAGLTPDDAEHASAISVAVQVMAAADVAGVTFTVSPRTGDRSVIAINASWGLGQAVVSGEVTPDEYWLSKVGPRITATRVAAKHVECVPAPSGRGVVMQDVPEERQAVACLDESVVLDLAAIALRVEAHYGHPVDIEWAVEFGPEGAARVALLQCRPETNWRKRRDEAAARAATPGTSTLLGVLAAAARTTSR